MTKEQRIKMKAQIIRQNRAYRALVGQDYFLRTEPSSETGTRWVFTDVSVYGLFAAAVTMQEALKAARG